MGKKAVLKIGADVKEAKNGIQQITEALNKMTKMTAAKQLSQLGSSLFGLKAAFSLVTTSIKVACSALDEMQKLYLAQAKAELQLETAAKNNPYLNGEGVAALKDYASQLQKTSTYGDETLLPHMARLAAAGRTQEEIMQIMSAAVDVAASGTMNLDTAVTALNKTYSGSAGQLGNQISAIKTLTKEELQNGKAVQIVAENYKGMASEVAKATGTREQLSNAMGDLKEELGAPFEKAMSPIRTYFTELIQGWTDALAAKRKYLDAAKKDESERNTEDYAALLAFAQEDYDKAVADATKKRYWFHQTIQDFGSAEDALAFAEEALSKTSLQQGGLWFKAKAVYDAKKRIDELTVSMNALSAAEKKKAEEAALKKRQDEINAGLKTEMERRDALRKQYADSIAKEKASIEAERKTGAEITEQAEAQRLLNVATREYITMMSDPAFDRSKTKSGTWAGEEDILSQIKELQKTANPFDQEGARNKFLSIFPDKKTAVEEATEYYDAQMEALRELYESIPEEYQEEFAPYYAEAGARLEKARMEAMEAIRKEERDALYNHLSESLEITEEFISKFSEISNTISDVIKTSAEHDATAQTLALEKRYAAGIVSAEEYSDKLTDIKRKQAQEEYKAGLWQWGVQLAQATASTAQAVVKALSESGNPAVGMAMAALVGTAGAAQIAAIIGSKPQPPSFSTGGIVGGTSYHGDRISANVNSGEMILTRAQQKRLFDTISSGRMGGMTNEVTIKNYASPLVSASAVQDDSGLKIYIQKTVAEQMAGGSYNQSLAAASNSMQGEQYTS